MGWRFHLVFLIGSAIVLGATGYIAGNAASAPQASVNDSTLRIDVDYVLVNVTVTDALNRYVGGLQKEHFRVFEDRIEQDIVYFGNEDAPMSLGVVLDTSGSMESWIDRARRDASQCLNVGNREDEYFLVMFSEDPYLMTGFTTNINDLQTKLLFTESKGRTAVYDAVYQALLQLQTGLHPRKALIIVSDGDDNWSRQSPSKLRELIREQELQIYTIGNRNSSLRDMAEITGGYALTGRSSQDLGEICNEVVRILKNQYLVGYRSTNQTRDGRLRNIRLQLDLPPNMAPLNLRHKTGYFALD